MNRLLNIWLILILVGMGLVSCENNNDWSGEGTLQLKIGVKGDIQVVQTRGETEPAPEETCVIKIYSSEGLIRKYTGIASIPGELQLSSGVYRTEASAGESVPASFNKKYFYGETDFEIKAGQVTQTDLVCRIMNSLVKVNFDESVLNIFSAYEVTVATSAASLKIHPENQDSVAYFMLPSDNKKITWTLKATALNGSKFEHTGSFQAAATTRYDLNIAYKPDLTPEGGGSVTIEIDTTPIEVNESEVPVHLAPKISGVGFDILKGVQVETGNNNPLSFTVAGSSLIESLLIQCASFTNWGLPFNQIDLAQLTPEEAAVLAAAGLEVTGNDNELTGQSFKKITFTSALMQRITAVEASHSLTIRAVDSNEKSREVITGIHVSNATVSTLEPLAATIYTNRAVLRGEVIRESEGAYRFRYRMVGASEWIFADAQRSGNSLSAQLTGLTPGTNYEYQVMVGDVVSNVLVRFTTESAIQLPNAGFEEWSGTSPLLIYGAGQSMFWDSGNHGSATMKKNVTEPDETIKQEGNRSIRLKSQFVGLGIIGKFAAGNLFVGKYLKTDGTDGVLGWGRPFASRPKALRGYIKYRPGTVDYTTTDKIGKGETDQGIVYVALGDWAGESAEGEHWPVVVKTKSQQFFDPSENNAGTIAYGEYVLNANTEGEEMIEFTIPLDYRDTRNPVSLVLVASASRYGDYFSGSSGSTMWLDNLEFIYE